jgi:signal transduction histidine kinase
MSNQAERHLGEIASKVFASGEMAEVIRRYDWSQTALGPIRSWQPALLVTLNTLLSTRHPMALLWGSDLIHFYNDSFRDSLCQDKHPASLGQTADHCWAEIWDQMQPRIEAALQRGESGWVENQHLPTHHHGKPYDAYWTYSHTPVRDLDGSICGVLITFLETTQCVQAERKLQSVLEATTEAILGIDRNWHVDYINQHAIEILAPAQNLIGTDVRIAIPLMLYEDSPYMDYYKRAMDQGIPVDFEISYPEPENQWIHIGVRPVPDGIVLFFHDITQRKLEHAALVRSERLAAVGRMASSIAHEINNPLESLTNLLYLLQNLEDSEQRTLFLTQAQNELNRITHITRQTLRFHRQSTEPHPVQVRDVLENVLALMQGRLRDNSISIETAYRTDRAILGYEADLRQVFANLVSNALDASSTNGRILLRVEESTAAPGEMPSVRVIVADNGHGMNSMTRRRIFDPFFTTRPLTGTGIGLWVSMEILNHHGAHVRVRSCQSPAHHGTVFSVIFPAAPPAALARSAPIA